MVKMQGLSSEEVGRLKTAGLDNRAVDAPSKSVKEIIISNVFTYFNFVFLMLAIVLLVVRSYRDLTFLPVIIANTLIGIIQGLRAKQILDKMTMLNAPRARVIRDGKEQTIVADDLVLGDVVIFKAGDQIPADAEVISGEIAVNEALLTGEADEIQKTSGAALMSGSFVISGECYAKLTKVGKESYISQLTLQAKAIKTGEQSEIIRSLNKIVALAGITIIPIGAILFIQQYVLGGLPIKDSIQAMAAAVIGMIPEGLFLLASVTLVISAMRLAQQQVLLHDMKSIETLARVDILCVDKTGTITTPEMSVAEIIALEDNQAAFYGALRDFIKVQKADNVTMETLKAYLKEIDRLLSQKVKSLTKVNTYGFSSKYKYSAVEFVEGSYVLGAPEFILKDEYQEYAAQISKYTSKGYRVLLFGKYQGRLDGAALQHKVVPQGLVVLANQVRPNAPATFCYFAEQGVTIKVISGDDPQTVSEVAKQAEIKGAEKYIDASSLDTEKTLASAMEKYTVFGRVTPEQKRRMVKALQQKGHTVAMTGDGVNDVLALKDADCSVAMASGSDAAVQAAQVVLLDSDFAKMPRVVLEGRRVVNNLERSGSLFLVKNIFSLVMALLSIFFGLAYPLLPTQLSFVAMWTIGVPSFFLAQIPNTDLIKGQFIKKVLKKAVPGALADVILVSITGWIGRRMGLSMAEVSTCATMVTAIVGIAFLYTVCRPLNKYRAIIFVSCIIGMTLCAIFLRWLYALVDNMPVSGVILIVVMGALAYPTLLLLQMLMKKIWQKVGF